MMTAVVAAMTLGELLGPAAGANGHIAITDLVADNRAVTPGAAFVALAGERHHGLDFAADAEAAGAAVVLYDAADGRPAPRGPSVAVDDLRAGLGTLASRFYGRGRTLDALIGVTGTNGKTTVAWLVAAASTALGKPCGYLGTLGYGMPGALKPQALTTPDCLTLHREIAELATPRIAAEVSSHALEQNRVAGLDFTIAAFTNLSRDHLDRHRTMDAYFEAKARLFERPGLKAAVINAGDVYATALEGRVAPGVEVIPVALGAHAAAAIRAEVTRDGLAGTQLAISGRRGEARIASRLVGEFNAENLLIALGALVAAGHEIGEAARTLEAVSPPPGRMEVFGGPPDRPWIVVDYAHTPAALERVLAELAAMTGSALSCVFGCGGERDRGKRPLMGEVAARYAAHIVLTDDNPRGEDPRAIVADIKSGIGRHRDLRVEHDRAAAIAGAVAAAGAGDVVLVAGKGHETVQIVGGQMRPFDDRAAVRAALEGRS